MGNRGMMGPGPNPHSPATSLPMSSPGAGMINSPRPMGSNPGTPVSGPPLSSPVLGKNSPGGGSSAQHGMPGGQDQFGNRMHFKSNCSKEANLMPVPSPQQIQFPLLDGQELTIQKQPNTSLRDSDLVSPSVGGDPSTPTPNDTKGPGTPGPGQAPPTPSSQQGEAPPKYPGGPNTPHTPTSEGGLYPGDGPATPHTPSRYPAPSPSPADPRFPIPASPGQGRLPGGMSPSHMPGMGPDNTGNMPLNPGTPSSQPNNPNMSNKGFDPISSMAQMSQQLAGAGPGSTPCSTPNSIGPGPDSGLGSMGNLEPGMMNSPLGGSMLGPDGNPVFSSSSLTPGHDSSPTYSDSAGPGGPIGMRPNGPGPMMGPRGPMMGPGGPMGGP